MARKKRAKKAGKGKSKVKPSIRRGKRPGAKRKTRGKYTG